MFDGIYFAVRCDENGDGKLIEDEVKEVSRVLGISTPTLTRYCADSRIREVYVCVSDVVVRVGLDLQA
jgi:hypothetical protein